MEFIERRVDRGDEEGDAKLSQSAIQKCGEDGVFGEVSAFANDQLNRSDGCVGNLGGKPAQERSDEP